MLPGIAGNMLPGNMLPGVNAALRLLEISGGDLFG